MHGAVSEIDTANASCTTSEKVRAPCGTTSRSRVWHKRKPRRRQGNGSGCLPLKTLGDALFLRNRIIARLEQAELQPDPEHRRWLMSFIIVAADSAV